MLFIVEFLLKLASAIADSCLLLELQTPVPENGINSGA